MMVDHGKLKRERETPDKWAFVLSNSGIFTIKLNNSFWSPLEKFCDILSYMWSLYLNNSFPAGPFQVSLLAGQSPEGDRQTGSRKTSNLGAF